VKGREYISRTPLLALRVQATFTWFLC
jgi:hypothetical protein